MNTDELALAAAPDVVAAMLVFIGLGLWIRPQSALGEPKIQMGGFSPVAQERLRDAMTRRKTFERVGTREIRAAGTVALIVAMLVFAKVIAVTEAFAVFTLFGLPILALGFTRSYNTARARAASLEARKANVIPAWQLAMFGFFAFAPLCVPARGHGHATGAVLACVAALVSLACTFWVAQAPSIMGAGDCQVDAFLDDRVRRVRTHQCALLGFMCAYGFIFLVRLHPVGADHDGLLTLAQLVNVMGLAGMFWPQRPPKSSDVLNWLQYDEAH